MFELNEATLHYSNGRDQANSAPALQNINLTIQTGEHVCLLGASGAGKSSLLGLLNGRLIPSSGSVAYDGESLQTMSVKRLRSNRGHMAWIPQDLGLVPSLRVNHNVSSGQIAIKGFWGLLRSLVWMSRTEKAEIHALLQQVGIPDKLFTRVDQLSGGQQQRVAIARALYQQPKVILADEPISAVDPARAEDLLKLLTQLAREANITLVMSLHDAPLARHFFGRLVGLREGRIVHDGEVTDAELQQLYRLS
ncbi:MAG: ATP-binding cassette domain-containing protein [Pseudomonadota bacterium]